MSESHLPPEGPSEQVQVKVQWVGTSSPQLPQYQSSFAAGVDLHAQLESPITLAPGERALGPVLALAAVKVAEPPDLP